MVAVHSGKLEDIGKFLDDVKRLDEGADIKVEEELGRGSYGRVFTLRYMGIRYAAKEIHAILYQGVGCEEQHKVKKSFYYECYHCSRLRHPNIVKFVGIYYPKDSEAALQPQCSIKLPVMVMELMSCSLTAFIEKKVTTVDTTIKRSILLDVALGLNYLHTQKPPIIHRDLSPNNIMLSLHNSGCLAKIGDLGVAKVISADSKTTKSKLTSVPGTVAFMPPEALLDDAVYDISLDVFSFGGITLHVITEEWPTPGAPTQFDIVTRSTRGFNEIERRQQYLDKMNGNVANSLRPLQINFLFPVLN